MLKKVVLVTLLAVVTFASSAQAFRLEGYNWGDSREEVLGKLSQTGWEIRPSRVKQMVETDAFLAGEPSLVQFMFNHSLKLNKIRISWDTTRVGDELRKTLTQRYGSPREVSPFNKHYAWNGLFRGEEILLDYFDQSGLPSHQTTLVFDGGSTYR